MAQEIRPGLWQLDIPLEGNPLKNLNSYLIAGERNLLIDTGFCWQSCRDAMHRELEQVGADLDQTDIFLTHLHSDHTGLAPELIRPGCKVYISTVDGPYMEEVSSDETWVTWYQNHMDNGFSQEEIDQIWGKTPSQGGAPKTWKQAVHLEDGAVLTYGGHSLRCILTPGHTPGHMCLYDEEYKWLFSGDHILFQISPNICRWNSRPDSLGDYLDSLRRIRPLKVESLFPAHRAESGNLQDRVDELLVHHKYRIHNTWQVVSDEPGLNAYQIAGRMRWRIRSKSWEDFPLTQKIFAVGETLAHLDYLEVRGWLTRKKEGGKYIYFPAEGKVFTPDDA